MKPILYLLTLLFTHTAVAHLPKAHYVGDSLCELRDYKNMTPVTSDCKSGRMLMEYNKDTRKYNMLFLALATNDAHFYVSPRKYRKHLKQLLRKSPEYTVCVLPLYRYNRNVEPYRKAMRRYCPVVVDPADYGVVADMPDGVHWTAANDQRMVNLINQQIINYLLFR